MPATFRTWAAQEPRVSIARPFRPKLFASVKPKRNEKKKKSRESSDPVAVHSSVLCEGYSWICIFEFLRHSYIKTNTQLAKPAYLRCFAWRGCLPLSGRLH